MPRACSSTWATPALTRRAPHIPQVGEGVGLAEPVTEMLCVYFSALAYSRVARTKSSTPRNVSSAPELSLGYASPRGGLPRRAHPSSTRRSSSVSTTGPSFGLAIGSSLQADQELSPQDTSTLPYLPFYKPFSLGTPLTGPTDWVTSVGFSPDGQTLAAGSSDGSIWLWTAPVYRACH